MTDIAHLAELVLAQDKRALARAITIIENGLDGARELMARIYPETGGAHVVGVTGAPGVGKSTAVDGLAQEFRRRGQRVGVLAVDPSSPFSGGAILGDRIRMQHGSLDPGVFIRSLASRGASGGLCMCCGDAVRLLEAAGYGVAIIETVGAGQGEVEIMRYAHTTLVVVVPGMGDEVQAIKAGILEIGDVFLVNKADLPGVDRLVRDLEMMLDLKPESPWRPPVLTAVAREGTGMAEATDAIERHAAHLRASGGLEGKRALQAEAELMDLVGGRLLAAVVARARERGAWGRACARIAGHTSDPYTEAERLLRRYAAEIAAPRPRAPQREAARRASAGSARQPPGPTKRPRGGRGRQRP